LQKLLKITSLLLIILLLIPMISFAANDTITLYINDKKINTDVPPEIRNGRTLVPVRVIFEQFDAKVYWNDTLKQVTVASESKTVILTINSNTAVVNSRRHVLDTAPVIKDGRTLVPVRFISETLGYEVKWEEKTRSVKINEKKTESNIKNETEEKEPVYTINNISVLKSEVQDTVTIKTNCEKSPYMMILADPFRIVLDFESTSLKGGDGKLNIDSGFIKEIRFAGHDDSSRVVIECKSTQPYSASFKSGVITIKTGSKDTYIKEEKEEEEKSEETEDTSSPSSPSKDNSSETEDTNDENTNNTENENTDTPEQKDPLAELKFLASRDENNILIILDAGHGGSDPGALGCDLEGNVVLKEKDVNLTVANKVAAILKKKGISYKQTRSTDKYLTLKEITDFANSANGDMFVSIHSNAVEDPEIHGTMVLYNGDGGSSYGISGKEIALNIKKEIIANVDVYDKGIISRPGLWVLRKTAMPAALVECAFVTNESDRVLLSDENVLDMFAKSIADGIEKSVETMKENIVKAKKELESKLKEKNIDLNNGEI